MAILLSMPGRHGDLLWAMATARAIQEGNPEEAIDLVVSGKYGSLVPLLQQQSYLRSVWADPTWVVEESAPMTPRTPSEAFVDGWLNSVASHLDGPLETYRHVALGYQGWPSAPLAQYVYQTVRAEHPDLVMAPLDLERPWITTSTVPNGSGLAVGFSEEYFECKVGILMCVLEKLTCVDPDVGWDLIYPEGSRWHQELWFGAGSKHPPSDWSRAAQAIGRSTVFLGCCSALHVLAVALGKRCVILEPNPQRHHEIFYPLGTTGRVRLVLGGDGKPTFDARHCADAVREALRG